MLLVELLKGTDVLELRGNADISVSGLSINSKATIDGNIFFALKGTITDGHKYIGSALENGAIVIVCEQMPERIQNGIAYVLVKDSSDALGKMVTTFYFNLSGKMKLVAVTGTNGKTTTATLLYGLFRQLGYKCGLLSTINNRIEENILPATHTTPDAISLNALLAQMVDAGCQYVFMEASSHAIEQNRIAGLQFAGAIFTNITHDHLDYHHTFQNYINAKKKLFDGLSESAWALTNKDDKNGLVMLQNCKASRFNYGISNPADFKVRILESDFNGLLLNLDGYEAFFRLTGKFNAYNLLSVYAAAVLCGMEKEAIITALSSLPNVAGRFDTIYSSQKVTGIIDYAHTPDALCNVLTAINEIRTHNEQLITVVGCGGDRDREKRPLMANIAAEESDKVILTSDNPRSESQEDILEQMAKGIPAQHYKKVLKLADRAEAIKLAVSLANPGDIILLAGKGHETYQEIAGVKYAFDDKKILAETFQLMEK
ncbi:MAG: UDP-N-acetylmuramoyl-L-alanyl-D-glutamate--2,6-diaminopimelate ligase [Flavobacteriaceae bacterium]|nr:UDP-N-acetylmuramoyl-L-alanyl-D-glutamate--2,6-diaminopimelate ligase [Flavobacteriaceae bacterium]